MFQVDEGLERAQKLLKQSQKRDYYKILGVSRSAITYIDESVSLALSPVEKLC